MVVFTPVTQTVVVLACVAWRVVVASHASGGRPASMSQIPVRIIYYQTSVQTHVFTYIEYTLLNDQTSEWGRGHWRR